MSAQSFTFGHGYQAAVPQQSAETALIKETTTRDFAKDVLDTSRSLPVLVDFWAPWCSPCKQLTPLIEKAVTAAAGKVRLVKMNIDDHPEIAGQLGIQSIPAVIAFVNGRPVDGFMGALPESQLMQFIERIAGPIGPSTLDQLLDSAKAALATAAFDEAVELFLAALEMDAESLPARAGLIRALVGAGRLSEARAVLDAVPEHTQGESALAGARAELELAEQAGSLGDTGRLHADVAADPANHALRYELALALAARGSKQEAVDHLVEIVRRERSWNEEAARKQLLQFFDAWGPTDKMTLYGRRKLSSVLFA